VDKLKQKAEIKTLEKTNCSSPVSETTHQPPSSHHHPCRSISLSPAPHHCSPPPSLDTTHKSKTAPLFFLIDLNLFGLHYRKKAFS